MKIIFTNNIGVNLDSANLMCFDYLKNYYPYEVWDVSMIYGAKGTVRNIEEAISIDSVEEFEHRLATEVKVQKVVIITNMVEKPWKKLSLIVKRYGIPVICTQKNSFHEMLQVYAACDFSIKMPIRHRIGGIVRKYRVTRCLYNKLRHSDVKYDYLIGAYNFKPETAINFINAHNTKYSEHLSNINSENIIGRKYILFIDSSLCYHPIDFNKPDPNFDEQHYLHQLNRYFELIEQKYGLPVIVSLHPVSYEHLSDKMFSGRLVSYGKTTQLIQHSEFTISHYSTSLINVVLAKKPAIIISSKEIESSNRRYQQENAEIFAKMCGFTKDSLDKPKLSVPTVDAKKYDEFIDKYVINESKRDKSNGEIILDLLRKIEHEK